MNEIKNTIIAYSIVDLEACEFRTYTRRHTK